MRELSVNLDHIATLREARKESFPDPVQAAVLAELGGADGITVHLRQDRRHIKERDLRLLRQTIKTELNLEMAATEEMRDIALDIKPDVVSLVPESPEEVTTQGGLDLVSNLSKVMPIAQVLKKAGIEVSVFIEAERPQIEAALKLGADRIEINTDLYSKDIEHREEILRGIGASAEFATREGLIVHAGHGIDYKNIIPLLKISEITGFSIGFSIIARAVFIGLREAVVEMKRIMEIYS